MTQAANRDYEFWRRALAGEKQSVQENALQPGYYKRRMHRDAPWLPVAFWRDREGKYVKAGEIACGFQGKIADPIDHWTSAAKHPVSEEDYRFCVANGYWPTDPPPPAAAGSNMPSDPFERLKVEVDDKLELAQRFLNDAGAAITDKRNCDIAANLASALLKLNGEADDLFEEEKKPILDAGRAVDAKFKFRVAVAEAVRKLKDMAGAFMAAEERRIEAEAKAARETEAARIAAERKELEDQDPALAHVTPQEELPLAAPKPKVQAGGGVGPKLGLKSVWTGTVTDYDKALAHFKDHPQVRALIADLVQGVARATKGTVEIPGVEIKEERRAA